MQLILTNGRTPKATAACVQGSAIRLALRCSHGTLLFQHDTVSLLHSLAHVAESLPGQAGRVPARVVCPYTLALVTGGCAGYLFKSLSCLSCCASGYCCQYWQWDVAMRWRLLQVELGNGIPISDMGRRFAKADDASSPYGEVDKVGCSAVWTSFNKLIADASGTS
jgi:hypothetical protein